MNRLHRLSVVIMKYLVLFSIVCLLFVTVNINSFAEGKFICNIVFIGSTYCKIVFTENTCNSRDVGAVMGHMPSALKKVGGAKLCFPLFWKRKSRKRCILDIGYDGVLRGQITFVSYQS
jgi:hypothetical protein